MHYFIEPDVIFQIVVILDEIKECKAFSHDDCQSVNIICSQIKEIYLSDFSKDQKEFFGKVVSFYTDLFADSNTFSSVIEEKHEEKHEEEHEEGHEEGHEDQEQLQEPSSLHWFSRIQSSLHSFFSSVHDYFYYITFRHIGLIFKLYSSFLFYSSLYLWLLLLSHLVIFLNRIYNVLILLDLVIESDIIMNHF